MPVDHSKQVYSEVFSAHPDRLYQDRPCGFKVYRYDATGNREVILFKSGLDYRDKTDAENAAAEWCEANGIDAEMM